MELEKIFILKSTRQYSRVVNIYVKGVDGKLSKRTVKFTTERLVDVKQRQTAAKKVNAEYWAKNEQEMHALLSSSAYGITFVRKDDPNGELKRPTILVSKDDAKTIALKRMFDLAKLPYDQSLPYSVLKEQYAIHIEALGGTKSVKETGSVPIPGEQIDIQQNIASQVEKARIKFEEDYGYPIPESVANDLAFIDGLSNPEFSAEAYIKAKEGVDEEEVDAFESMSIEGLRDAYKEKEGVNVPTPKKNNREWIIGKIK